MKILILSWEIYPIYCGGLGVLVNHLVKELINQGHNVTIAVPNTNGLTVNNVIDMKEGILKHLPKLKPIAGLDFKLKRFNLKIFKTVDQQVSKIYSNDTPTIAQAYAYAINDHLVDNNYDIILGMDWVSIPTFKLLKNLVNPTPFSFYINGTETDRNYGAIMSKTSFHIHNLEKRFYNQCEQVFTVSSITKSILVKDLKCKASKIHIIHNDSEFKLITESIHKREPKKILFLGRLAYQKGLRYLMISFRKLLKLDSSAQLYIVGNGSEINMIQKYIDKHDISSNINLVGWLEGEEKEAMYQSSKIFVMPSVSEPFGLTALEAIRMGVPTLASNRCGFCDVIPSTPTFDYRNTREFAKIMYDHLNNQALWSKLINSQQSELGSHSWSEQVSKLIRKIGDGL
jgi:glycogen synthase